MTALFLPTTASLLEMFVLAGRPRLNQSTSSSTLLPYSHVSSRGWSSGIYGPGSLLRMPCRRCSAARRSPHPHRHRHYRRRRRRRRRRHRRIRRTRARRPGSPCTTYPSDQRQWCRHRVPWPQEYTMDARHIGQVGGVGGGRSSIEAAEITPGARARFWSLRVSTHSLMHPGCIECPHGRHARGFSSSTNLQTAQGSICVSSADAVPAAVRSYAEEASA
ncbi:hypothetical protein BJ166DRAFT_605344 [Pestalotiopsis sp. NC0098]|nr:hypothetical protein BJ166DRAFT_605344 [Pestalotiopsis sp. NC0098]